MKEINEKETLKQFLKFRKTGVSSASDFNTVLSDVRAELNVSVVSPDNVHCMHPSI